MQFDLEKLKNEALKEIKKTADLKTLENLEIKYLGRKGELTQILRALANLPEKERKDIGGKANEIKNFLFGEIGKKRDYLKSHEFESVLAKEKIDITAPGTKIEIGHLHPITLVLSQIEKIFGSMGFEIAEGPEIETEWYNFDALNIPENHPAREMWDTFWLRQKDISKYRDVEMSKCQNANMRKSENLLLRTHTSPVQIRYMQAHNPPFRIIAPGRIFRYEATDPSHSHTFYQLEGLMIDKDINIANFKAIISSFFQKFFKKDIKIRLRPSFYPFVEPGFDVDINCVICNGKGCSVCSKRGWLELAGAGMVHSNVFKAVGYNPKDWQGFAFGFGIDRLTIMKYKIDDIRLFYEGDLRFINQF